MQSFRTKDLRSHCLPRATTVLGITKLGCKLWHAVVGAAHNWPMNPKNCKQNINCWLTTYSMELANILINSFQYGVPYQISCKTVLEETKGPHISWLFSWINSRGSQKRNLYPDWKQEHKLLIPCQLFMYAFNWDFQVHGKITTNFDHKWKYNSMTEKLPWERKLISWKF
jgi:hypothetical protein